MLKVLYFSFLMSFGRNHDIIEKSKEVVIMDLETLGYFLYMDSIEKKQKQEQVEMMRDIFGESDDSEDDEDE